MARRSLPCARRRLERVPTGGHHTAVASRHAQKHLVGGQSVLRYWRAPEFLCNAALFHSIYGTEGFQGYCLPLSYRADIAELIGPRAERLAWIFCMVDRYSVDVTVLAPDAGDVSAPPPTFYARPEVSQRASRMWDAASL